MIYQDSVITHFRNSDRRGGGTVEKRIKRRKIREKLVWGEISVDSHYITWKHKKTAYVNKTNYKTRYKNDYIEKKVYG